MARIVIHRSRFDYDDLGPRFALVSPELQQWVEMSETELRELSDDIQEALNETKF